MTLTDQEKEELVHEITKAAHDGKFDEGGGALQLCDGVLPQREGGCPAGALLSLHGQRFRL